MRARCPSSEGRCAYQLTLLCSREHVCCLCLAVRWQTQREEPSTLAGTKRGGEHTKGTRECTHELEVCVLTHMYVYGMPVFLCNTSAICSNQSTLTTK